MDISRLSPIHSDAAIWHARLCADDAVDADRVAFDRWLADGDAHRLAYADVCAASYAIEQWVPSTRVILRRRRPRVMAWVALAACLVLSAMAVLFSTTLQDWHSDLHSGVGVVLDVPLEDGSHLWLAPDSAVDVRIEAHSRRIEVRRGAVFATVASDPSRPFDIVAGEVTARAIGTRYAVSRDVDRTRVAVEEGQVDVRRAGNGEVVTLRAGNALAFDTTGGMQLHPAGNAAFAWRDGMLVLEQATLGEALQRIDAYMPQRIVWLGANTHADVRVTAAIPADQTRQMLDALVAEHQLSRYDIGGVVTVIR